MSKVKNLVILGVGYVLGAQAGRARYEQLKQQALRVAEHPRTQQLARTAREQVTTRLPGSVTERLPQSVSSRLGTAPSAGGPAGADRDVVTGTAGGADRDVVTEPVVEGSSRPGHL